MAEDERATALLHLGQVVQNLKPPQLVLLTRMAEAMGTTIESNVAADSDIVTTDFSLAFSNYLLLHHAIHEERMNKKAFEYAFKYAGEADHRRVRLNTDPINSAEDLWRDGVAFSLKTQADKNINSRAIYIQKLMEARWIRDCVTQEDFAREAGTRISKHLAGYQRILVLRAFEHSPTLIAYDLVEIPRDLLMRIGSLEPGDFSPRNKYGSSGANVRDERGVAFRVLLDGSVEKVRIFNLRIDRCKQHGEWRIPRPDIPGDPDE